MASKYQPPVLLQQLVGWLDRQLCSDDFISIDAALNGLQVGDLNAPVDKVALACDACDEVIARAAGCQLLIVHHGIFWGSKPIPVRGRIYRLVAQLLEQKCALYATHLPLDAHRQWGNNAVLARRLPLINWQPFAHLHGLPCGISGQLSQPMDLAAIAQSVFPENSSAQLFPFSKKQPQKIAIVSGSGCFALQEALDLEIDLLISGDVNHQHYHFARENEISVIAGGHYYSEIGGVQALGKQLAQHFGLSHHFIDFPTGL